MNIPEPVEQPTEGVGIAAILKQLERELRAPQPRKYPQPKRRKKSQ